MEDQREHTDGLPPKPRRQVLYPGVRVLADQFQVPPDDGPEVLSPQELWREIASMVGRAFGKSVRKSDFVQTNNFIRTMDEATQAAEKRMKELAEAADQMSRALPHHWSNHSSFNTGGVITPKEKQPIKIVPDTQRRHGPPVRDKRKNFRRENNR